MGLLRKTLMMLIILLVVCAGVFAQYYPKEETFASCRELIDRHGLSAESWDAATLNRLGYILYTRGLFGDAAQLFRGAMILDYSFVLPYYNLACMLSLQYGQGEEIEMWELFEALNTSIMMDPSRAEKIKADSDLDPIRHLDRFKELENIGVARQMIVRFDSINVFEGSLSVIFIDEAGESIWIHNTEVDFEEEGFFRTEHTEGSVFNTYIVNEDFVGRPFRLLYTTKMIVGEFSGLPNPEMVLLDIESVK